MGSGTSDTEHVPEPLLFVFTLLRTDSTVNVRGCSPSDAASTLISVEASQFGSLKIATVMLASLPRKSTFGKGALGLMSMRCVLARLELMLVCCAGQSFGARTVPAPEKEGSTQITPIKPLPSVPVYVKAASIVKGGVEPET